MFLMFSIKFYRKKLQTLEKDRQDLQSTIKALQEGMHTETCSSKKQWFYKFSIYLILFIFLFREEGPTDNGAEGFLWW